MRSAFRDQPREARGRFAPSPTGLLHLGNARTALVTWLSIRRQRGRMVWRIEDLDPPRVVAGAADHAMRDLRWLGLDWDEGPDVGGPHAPYRQSRRSTLYEEALELLARKKRLFPCALSRRDIREIASAPHGRNGIPPYPAELRPGRLPRNWFADFGREENPEAALRFLVADEMVSFTDLVYDRIDSNVAHEIGDFVLKRRDGLFAYQLAVVVDDIAMDITEVVRGADLLDSTARQIQLFQALEERIPEYAHVPLVVDHEGRKLSKRNEDLTLAHLREVGAAPQQVVGFLAASLGLIERLKPVAPQDLVDRFSWSVIPRAELVLPRNVPHVVCSIT